jgi:hypothetical protein
VQHQHPKKSKIKNQKSKIKNQKSKKERLPTALSYKLSCGLLIQKHILGGCGRLQTGHLV